MLQSLGHNQLPTFKAPKKKADPRAGCGLAPCHLNQLSGKNRCYGFRSKFRNSIDDADNNQPVLHVHGLWQA